MARFLHHGTRNMDSVLISVVFLLTLSSFQTAGQQEKQVEQSDALFKSESTLVELHATVTDSGGKLLTELPESSFRVTENGIPQKISLFRREDAPVSLGLIIDNSVSMGPKRLQVASAALALVRSSNPDDEVFLINFNDASKLARDYTRNIADLEAALSTIDSAGATAIRDALMMGLEHLKSGARNQKKVLLVISDGEDNSSQVQQVRLLRAAQQSGIIIYSIGLLGDADPRESARAKRELDAITLATGGEVFYPTNLDEVEGVARHVAKDLRNQYTIAYKSTDERQNGTFRKIRVTVADPPGAVVKTREGYFAGAGPS